MVGDREEPLSFHALLDAVRETTLNAYAHQDLPFEKILEALRVPRDLSRTRCSRSFSTWSTSTRA